MIVASISNTLGEEWLSLNPVRVGRIPPALSTPDCYVTVSEAERPLLRVDVYADGPDCFAFQDAIIWRGQVVVGFGSHVHVVPLKDQAAATIALDSYFGHLYPTADYLLIASGERLFRLEPDGSILWRSPVLGIDGVVVTQPEPPVIHGEGEWDPPGGWKPFEIRVTDGGMMAAEARHGREG